MKSTIAATALVLLLLTFGAEALLCTSYSKIYKGQCTQDYNCANICTTEKYTGGYCHGKVFRKCICTKDCEQGERPPPPDGGGDGGGDDGGDEPPAELTA